MIQLLKDYYDKKGNRYKAITYSSGKYLCESYSTGKKVYLLPNELFTSPPPKETTDIIPEVIIKPTTKNKASDILDSMRDLVKAELAKKERKLESSKAKIEHIKQETPTIPKFEPQNKTCDEEKKVDEIIKDVEQITIPEFVEQEQPKETDIVHKDNIKETAEDFYADL